MKKPQPKRLDVSTDKKRAEREKKDRFDAIAFAKTLPESKWLK